MSDPMTFFFRHIAVGFGVAALFLATCLFFDLGGLHTLLLKDARGLLATAMLWISNGALCGALQVAWAVSVSDDT